MSNGKTENTPGQRDLDRVRHAKSLVVDRLLRIPGVHSVGVGYKRVGGQPTGQLAVLVFVDEKLPRSAVEPQRLVPAEVRFHWESAEKEEVVPTDVIERGRAVEYTHIADGALEVRVRPVPGGFSITTPSAGGTLGGWVWDDLNDEPVLLSNNHVLGGTAGTDVFQPWSSTLAADHIADVVRTGTLDASIAAPDNGDLVSYEIEGLGPAVYETAEATLGMAVEKCGAKTEHTTGTVTAVDVSSHYGALYFVVDRDAGIDRFAYYGDSGSLIVERTNPSGANWKRVVGLLWGGVPSERNGFAHQIADVFADLNLKTVCAGVLEGVLDSMFSVRPEEMREPAPEARWRGAAIAREDARFSWRRPVSRGIARSIEKRLGATERGRHLVELVHRHRIGLLHLLLDPGVRRAVAAAVGPIVGDAWTADEVFARRLSGADVERLRRLRGIVASSGHDVKPLLDEADQILKRAEGRPLAEILK